VGTTDRPRASGEPSRPDLGRPDNEMSHGPNVGPARIVSASSGGTKAVIGPKRN
jgi:hypothetical protein